MLKSAEKTISVVPFLPLGTFTDSSLLNI